MPSVKAGPLTANKGMCSALSKAHPMQNLPVPAAGYTHKGKTPPSLLQQLMWKLHQNMDGKSSPKMRHWLGLVLTDFNRWGIVLIKVKKLFLQSLPFVFYLQAQHSFSSMYSVSSQPALIWEYSYMEMLPTFAQKSRNKQQVHEI